MARTLYTDWVMLMFINFYFIVCSIIIDTISNVEFNKQSNVIKIKSQILDANFIVLNLRISLKSEKWKPALKESNINSSDHFCIVFQVPQDKVLAKPSPIINMKAYKNNIEAEGMKNAHIRDAVALCQLWSTMEEEVVTFKICMD